KAVNGNEGSVFSISATFPAGNTAGNFLIVTGTAARPAGTITISDTAGNTYLPAIGPVTDPGQDTTAYLWYVPSAKGGPNTVTLTPTSARALEIHLSEWVGLASASPVDQIATATGNGTAVSAGPVTTTTAGELVFGYGFVFNVASAGAGVQFQLDGVNLGAEVTTSPYSISWDTTTVVDGSHSLTAIARNTAGLTTTSSRVAVTVSNGLASTGQWSAPFDLGIVAVNSVLLHTGKVLMFSGSYTSTGVERVWDPVTGTITLVPN